MWREQPGTGAVLLYAVVGRCAGRGAGAVAVRRAGLGACACACTCTRGGREKSCTAIATGCKGHWRSRARVVLGILIGTSTVQLSCGYQCPIVLLHERVRRNERLHRFVSELMFQNDEAGTLGACQPSFEVGLDRLRIGSSGFIKRPVLSVLVPYDGRETKYLFSDGRNPGVSVTIWWAPKTSQSAPSGIIYQLKTPPQLRNNILVGQCSHIRMSVGMYRDVILVDHEGSVERFPELDDIDANVEVGCFDLVLLKEFIQTRGRRKRAIIEADG